MEVLVSNVKIICKIRLISSDKISFNTDNVMKRYNNFTIVKKNILLLCLPKQSKIEIST